MALRWTASLPGAAVGRELYLVVRLYQGDLAGRCSSGRDSANFIGAEQVNESHPRSTQAYRSQELIQFTPATFFIIKLPLLAPAQLASCRCAVSNQCDRRPTQ